MKEFDFNNLFVLDLANNHQGDFQHGIDIIQAMGKVAKDVGVRAAIKFQFRQLDTFIHPDYKDKADVQHIPRFISTALPVDNYRKYIQEIKQQGMEVICTPFDEQSVDVLVQLDIGIIKVASCSATDWPLLQKISQANKPVIISTAGLNLGKIDRLVSFFEVKGVSFALMHCVAVYPTPDDKLMLNQLDLLKRRYPQLTIGFSTHENPDNTDAIKIAYAKGARIFERHIGISTEKHNLNGYSADPIQIKKWMTAYQDAVEMCGGEERMPIDQAEAKSLESLQRGVFASKKIKKGQTLDVNHVFFAMPLQQGQMTSGTWVAGIIADRDYAANEPICDAIGEKDISDDERIFSILLQVKGMLNRSKIFIGKDSSIEVSHHYGLQRFREYGAVLVDCINRDYCKKLIIMLPRQKHPYHLHKKKEETFQLLSGDLEVEIDGHKTSLNEGDTLLVGTGQWHKFHTLDGAIFEEVSTTHYNDDSYYEDETVSKLKREDRKTKISNWENAEIGYTDH